MNAEDERVYRIQASLGATKRCLGCGRTKLVYQFEGYGRFLCRACVTKGVSAEAAVRSVA